MGEGKASFRKDEEAGQNGCNKLTIWQAETFQDETLWLCDDCKENWQEQQEVVQ
jgi:hypothetical protein